MTLYRIHIRPKGGKENVKKSFDYCLEKNVLGMGWPIELSSLEWAEYESQATEIYGKGKFNSVKYLKRNIKENDLLWTRDTKGNYYLAKTLSEWEYLPNQEALDADIINVVRCNLIEVPSVDDVPGKVIACFRPARTIQAIRDATTADYSKYLWNKISNTNFFSFPEKQFDNVFSFLDSEETEEIVFIYFQINGWVVVPNSRKVDTMNYEFYLINKKTKEKAIVQVKTGHTSLSPKEWVTKKEKVFLFQSNNKYNEEAPSTNIVCLSPIEIKEFMYSNRELLPSNINHWLDVADKKI